MFLALSALVGLAQQCAPAVAPQTLLAVVRAESGFDPLVVAVNGAPRLVLHPEDRGGRHGRRAATDRPVAAASTWA